MLQRALFPFWVYSTWLARRRAREKKVQSWIKARGAPTPAPRAACSVTLLWRRSARVFLPLGAPGAAKPATTMTRCRESKAHACTRRHTQPRARAHIQVEPWRWVGGGGQGERGEAPDLLQKQVTTSGGRVHSSRLPQHRASISAAPSPARCLFLPSDNVFLADQSTRRPGIGGGGRERRWELGRRKSRNARETTFLLS